MRISDWSSDVCSSDLPERNCPLRRLFMEAHLDRRRVDAMPRHPLIEPPCAVGAQIAGEGTAEGDDLFDRLRQALCDLARVKPAKAPADDGDGTMPLGKQRSALHHPLDQAGPQSPVPSQDRKSTRLNSRH